MQPQTLKINIWEREDALFVCVSDVVVVCEGNIPEVSYDREVPVLSPYTVEFVPNTTLTWTPSMARAPSNFSFTRNSSMAAF